MDDVTLAQFRDLVELAGQCRDPLAASRARRLAFELILARPALAAAAIEILADLEGATLARLESEARAQEGEVTNATVDRLFDALAAAALAADGGPSSLSVADFLAHPDAGGAT